MFARNRNEKTIIGVMLSAAKHLVFHLPTKARSFGFASG